MNRIAWWMVDSLSRTLEPDERDAVCGDFAESGESGAQALRGLVGLVARRQAALWKGWRPWVAPVGLLAPVLSGILGIGWISWQFRTIWTHGVRYEVGMPLADDLVRFVCFGMLAIMWAWIGGLALASWSPRTAWVHPALICPLLWFGVATMGALFAGQLREVFCGLLPLAVLFLIPLLCGVYRGARRSAIGTGNLVWLAAAIATVTLIAQVEDGRSSLAFAAWRSGTIVDGRLIWTPHLLPFAGIVWQFGLIFATTGFKETHT